MCSIPNGTEQDKHTGNVDIREALFNTGEVGPTTHIQVSTERITILRGILLDLDPGLYRTGALLSAIPSTPAEFYSTVVQPWLENDSVLKKAEIRNSGTGIHCILRFAEPLVFDTAGERDRWGGIIKVVQAALPTDPDAPGITAVTRQIGSVNSENNGVVEMLRPGEGVTVDEVESLFDELNKHPFKTVFRILVGAEHCSPCPVCGEAGTKLSALNRVGICYGSCGTVKLAQLFDLVLAPRSTPGKEAQANDKSPK